MTAESDVKMVKVLKFKSLKFDGWEEHESPDPTEETVSEWVAAKAQKLHDDWLINFIDTLNCYSAGVSVLSEEPFEELRKWYNE